MMLDAFVALVSGKLTLPSAILTSAPYTGLALGGIAAANGGFVPGRSGGAAAGRGRGAQRLRRHVACNIIVGPYCVTDNEAL